ncbi:MAG TPA: lipid II flippase MurJ [Anaerolineales bacterium]|nr:lipid II flippase MurJ [Anaerolineales bacterium]
MLTLREGFRSFLNAYSNWKGSSIHRRILGATLIVAVFTGVAKVVFFSKELVVAWRFGTTDLLDAFLIAYVVPSFAINLIAGSINAAVMPTYVQARERAGQASANDLYASVMTLSIVFLTVCTGLLVLSAPLYLQILASGFPEDKLKLTLDLLYVISPVIILSGITTIRSAILNAGEKFVTPALIPVVTPAITIVLILAGGAVLGIYSLALGLVIGQLIESSWLGFALRRRGVTRSLGWHGFDANLRQIVQQFVPMVAGAFLLGSTQLVDQGFAASLPAGNVAVLNYGNKVISFPLQIAATAIGTSFLPYFSSMLAKNDWDGARQTLKRYLKLIFLLTVPLTLLLIIFSEPLVRLLLQRGAFTEADTKIVAQVQALGALQIPFYLGGILIVRLISAMKANHILMWGAGLSLVINFLADYLLMKIFGVAGISFSTSIVYFSSFVFLWFMLRSTYGRMNAN